MGEPLPILFVSCFAEESNAQIQRTSLAIPTRSSPVPVAFFNRNWAGACWNRWAGPLDLGVGLLCKNTKQKGLAGARMLPLRCLSRFFHAGENINCLGNEVLMHKSVYLSLMGWPSIYNG